jgi:hypothetical protein
MGVDFPLAVVRREKADDLALPNAAIEMVVFIENDILGTVDLAEADDLRLVAVLRYKVLLDSRRRTAMRCSRCQCEQRASSLGWRSEFRRCGWTTVVRSVRSRVTDVTEYPIPETLP